MKVDSAIIDSIGVKYRDDPDNCYREGLNVWLKHGKRSWGDVVEALRSPSVNHTTIAQEIEIHAPKEGVYLLCCHLV